MQPRDPRAPHPPGRPLAEEADGDELIFACASCGCSSCIYYWDVEDQRAAEDVRALRTPRWRHPHR